MTGTNTKVRALFLSALMVLSVFGGTVALAGTAAAGNTTGLTISDDTAGASGVTYTHSFDTTGGTVQYVDVNFGASNPDLASVTASDVQMYVNGVEYQDGFSQFSTSGSTVEFKLSNSQDGINSGTNITVVVGDVVNGDQGTGYTFQTELSDTSDQSVDSASGLYDIQSAGGGGGPSDQDPPYELNDADDTFDTGTTRWSGQSLFLDTGVSQNTTYELHEVNDDNEVGQLVTQVTVTSSGSGDTGTALVNTNGLDGEYVLLDDSGEIVTTNSDGLQQSTSTDTTVDSGEIVDIVPQNFEASFDDSTVAQGDDVDINFDSNRANYQVTVDSEGLSDSDLEDTFGADANADLDGYQVDVDSNDDTVSGTLEDDVSTGNFTFDFEVVDTEETSSDNLEIRSGTGVEATFEESASTEERGDVAAITVDLQNTDEADIRIGDESVNYNVTLTVTDGDDDDESVTILWNTHEAGRVSDESVAFDVEDSEDSISNVRRFSEDIPTGERLAATDYDLTASVDGEGETDVAVVSVTERSTDSAQQWTAPRGADYENATELLEQVSQSNDVAQEDLAVTQVQASGIFGVLDASDVKADLADGSNNGVTVTIEQASADPNRDPKEVSVDQNAVDIVLDADNNQHFVVVDTGAATAERGVESGLSLEDGETYNVTFEIDGDNSDYVPEDETESVTAQFTVVERTGEFDVNADEQVQVDAAADQTISGTTNVAPGTELTVRARSTGDSPFLLSNTTEVTSEGTFSATFDFSNVSQGTNFTATIPSQGFEDNAETPGVVAPAPTASVSISDQTSDGSTVTVGSASLSDGGFVTIHDGSLLDGDTFESVRGTSAYLESGSHSDISVSLDTPYEDDGTVIAMPHLDTNGNEAYDFVSSDGAEDAPYTANGSAVTDSASLTVDTPTPTPSPTPTDEPTPTPTDEPTPTPTDEPTPTPSPTDGGGPGFGLAAALIALAGAALLALRRD